MCCKTWLKFSLQLNVYCWYCTVLFRLRLINWLSQQILDCLIVIVLCTTQNQAGWKAKTKVLFTASIRIVNDEIVTLSCVGLVWEMERHSASEHAGGSYWTMQRSTVRTDNCRYSPTQAGHVQWLHAIISSRPGHLHILVSWSTKSVKMCSGNTDRGISRMMRVTVAKQLHERLSQTPGCSPLHPNVLS